MKATREVKDLVRRLADRLADQIDGEYGTVSDPHPGQTELIVEEAREWLRKQERQ